MSFEALSPGATEALTYKGSEAEKLLGRVVVPKERILFDRNFEIPESFNHLATSELYNDILSSYSYARALSRQLEADETIKPIYELPELKFFEGKIHALETAFSNMYDVGWEPSVVFVPESLDRDQWTRLFETKQVDLVLNSTLYPDDRLGFGTYSDIRSPWDVAVISTQKTPQFGAISDLSLSDPAKVSELAYNLNIPLTQSTIDTIQLATPTTDMYLALQFLLLNKGLYPVDIDSYAIAINLLEPDKTPMTLAYKFHQDGKIIAVDNVTKNDSFNQTKRTMIRVSRKGSDVVS